MHSNLNTTIKAYFKLSPSELDNYVRKTDLESELGEYVKEAPTDGFTYGRRDKQWVELEASAVRNLRLRWGTADKEVLNGDDIVSLEKRADMYQEGKDTYVKILTIPVVQDSYIWLCCSRKIVGVECELSEGYMGPWDYQLIKGKDTPDSNTVLGADGVPYYCYRTTDKLSAGHTWTILVTMNAHRESD